MSNGYTKKLSRCEMEHGDQLVRSVTLWNYWALEVFSVNRLVAASKAGNARIVNGSALFRGLNAKPLTTRITEKAGGA